MGEPLPPPPPSCFTYARVALQKDLRSQARGDDAANEHAWELKTNLLQPGHLQAQCAEPVGGVPGAFLVADVLSAQECAAIISLAERVGFTSGEALVEVPTSVRQNGVALLVAQQSMVETLGERLALVVPRAGTGGARRCEPDFINRRWRCYRYLPAQGSSEPSEAAQFFGAHHDGEQPRSDIRDGVLIDDEPGRGVVRLSQMSVLLYLSGGHRGGETVFYPAGEAEPGAPAVRVEPRAGVALCFWHGRHPLSPLHEGAPLEPPPPPSAEAGEARAGMAPAREQAPAPKYVLRTDVLFETEAAPVHSDSWGESSYVRAMLHAGEVWSRAAAA